MLRGFIGLALGGLLFAAMPSSTNYGLHNYGFGSGGTSSSSSSSYKLNGISGETSNVQSASTTYKVRSGNNNSQQANVPPAPTFTNPSSYYNKLQFVINTGSNPTDTKYLIAISSDNFVTTQYIQSDDTVGNSVVIGDYQTYAVWGGAAGQLVLGLSPSTTYKIKVSAIQGTFTQTEFGPTASASTVAPSITFGIHTDSQPSAPFSAAFGNLLPGTVTTAANKVWISLDTNANSGGYIHIASTNAGLHSARTGATITSATADLSSASTGYGAQGFSVAQTTGGPLTMFAPFNGSGQIVGALLTRDSVIFKTAGQVTGGSGAFQLKAKAAALTPAASDYQDTLTLTAAAAF